MSSLSRLMNDTLFFTDKSSLLWVDSSREKSKSNLWQKTKQKQDRNTWNTLFTRHTHTHRTFPRWLPPSIPLIELWVEVSLLGGCLPLTGALLVRQQEQADVRVCPVLGTRGQGPVGYMARSHAAQKPYGMETLYIYTFVQYMHLQEWTVIYSRLSSIE